MEDTINHIMKLKDEIMKTAGLLMDQKVSYDEVAT